MLTLLAIVSLISNFSPFRYSHYIIFSFRPGNFLAFWGYILGNLEPDQQLGLNILGTH